jgi:hypothetical protein
MAWLILVIYWCGSVSSWLLAMPWQHYPNLPFDFKAKLPKTDLTPWMMSTSLKWELWQNLKPRPKSVVGKFKSCPMILSGPVTYNISYYSEMGVAKSVKTFLHSDNNILCPPHLGNSSKGMGPSEICIPPSTPKQDDTIIQHGFLSATMPHLHATPPPHPYLSRPRYAIASMYVCPMGKFPPFLTTIFHFINVLLVCCHQAGQLPTLPHLCLLPLSLPPYPLAPLLAPWPLFP